jgi:hypothetical protein
MILLTVSFAQGDEYIRFAMVENPQRTKQAIRGIKQVL